MQLTALDTATVIEDMDIPRFQVTSAKRLECKPLVYTGQWKLAPYIRVP